MVEVLAPAARRLDEEGEALLHALLAHVVGEPLRTQARIQGAFLVQRRLQQGLVARFAHVRQSSLSAARIAASTDISSEQPALFSAASATGRA